MDEEIVPKLTVFTFEILFLFLLVFVLNQFVGDIIVSISASLIFVSLVTDVLAFRETMGITLMVFVFSFVFLSIVLGSMITALFLSSILMAAFVLINVLRH